jgi:diadenosine tetraphosphatase ApaH/serine/threonine PP2A family protein phosphatase
MRCAILADIHSNLAALTAVLDDIASKGKVDEVWCLGDIVGYGPDPGECIKLLRKLKAVCVAGNHDLGAIGKIELSYFNPVAAEACEWTAEQLNAADALYLDELPKTIVKGDFLLVHGSPSSHLFEYVISTSSAAKNFSFFSTPYCLVGHTHVPLAFREEKGKVTTIALSPGIGLILSEPRMIINPGAVGQPRDGDPRASYAIYDSEGSMFRLYRVPYDIRATQDKMMQAGLPPPLIMRLEEGK